MLDTATDQLENTLNQVEARIREIKNWEANRTQRLNDLGSQINLIADIRSKSSGKAWFPHLEKTIRFMEKEEERLRSQEAPSDNEELLALEYDRASIMKLIKSARRYARKQEAMYESDCHTGS